MDMRTSPAQPPSSERSSSPLSGDLRSRVIELLRIHGIQRAGVFGSMARGEARPESDLDLLIEPSPDMTLFGFSALALALEDLIGRPVDLVTYASLNPHLRASVYASYDELFDMSDDQARDSARDKAGAQ